MFGSRSRFALAVALTAAISLAAGPAAAQIPVVEVAAEDYAFRAPDEIPAGWTTFRFTNEGEEHHFLVVSRLPEGKTPDDYVLEVAEPFNRVWYGLRDGALDVDAALGRLGETIPEWFWSGFEPRGGAGLVVPGGTAEATVELEPGTYILECYMKTPEGEFHALEGMFRPLVVTAGPDDAAPPAGDVRLTLSAAGIEMQGEPGAGRVTFEVHFAEHPGGVAVGNGVHVARLDDDATVEQIVPWMSWLNLDGLVEPAPATFIGGSQPRPEGQTTYFTVELEPGRYLLIAEATAHLGAVKEFTVAR